MFANSHSFRMKHALCSRGTQQPLCGLFAQIRLIHSINPSAQWTNKYLLFELTHLAMNPRDRARAFMRKKNLFHSPLNIELIDQRQRNHFIPMNWTQLSIDLLFYFLRFLGWVCLPGLYLTFIEFSFEYAFNSKEWYSSLALVAMSRYITRLARRIEIFPMGAATLNQSNESICINSASLFATTSQRKRNKNGCRQRKHLWCHFLLDSLSVIRISIDLCATRFWAYHLCVHPTDTHSYSVMCVRRLCTGYSWRNCTQKPNIDSPNRRCLSCDVFFFYLFFFHDKTYSN